MIPAANVKHEKPPLIPGGGQRVLIVGQTGSGKTEFAIWLLERVTITPIIIYDTKGERAFEQLPNSRLVFSDSGVAEAIDDPTIDYVVFRIHPETIADDRLMDAMLWKHFNDYREVGCYIDELFSFSQGGRAGRGLVALLTQGRSRGITTIMSAQRPSWLSRFAITEAQKYYIFRLVDRKDKARLGDVIPGFADLGNPPEYGFYFYAAGEHEPQLMARIMLDKNAKREDNQTSSSAVAVPDIGTALNWI